ncbi:Hypothetical protein, putative [Bodo saltans]|uniref:Uncharacterized protein n=1 Tax=Bodo saltans TaxID=75058 RepID=A0A0S4JJ10_BODSA|nr:Hypothetical protein, putative [Bodo saltans]|eukprot:CUG90159.1 Hypothetical protein, putative [Bodo saltans]
MLRKDGEVLAPPPTGGISSAAPTPTPGGAANRRPFRRVLSSAGGGRPNLLIAAVLFVSVGCAALLVLGSSHISPHVPVDGAAVPLVTQHVSQFVTREPDVNSQREQGDETQVVDSAAPSTSVVECALSKSAAEAKIWNRLFSRCRYCNVTASGLPKTPSFCASGNPPSPAPRFDFSQMPSSQSSTFRPSRGDKLPVVYVALGQRFRGPGGQSYVVDAIRQWRLFHSPNVSDVYLLLDDNMTKLPEIVECVQTYSVQVVVRSEIMTPLWKQYADVFYIQGYMHPGGSRQTGHKQFNQLVSERFFALHGVMRLKNLKNIFHFENDNMVYADMRPAVIAAERCGYAIGTTFANRKQAIPGTLYIRDASSIEALCQFIVSFLSCGELFGRKFTSRMKDYANDMTYMMTFYQLYGTRALGALPAWEHSAGENCVADLTWRPRTMPLSPDSTAMLGPAAAGGATSESYRGALFDLGGFGQWYSFSVGKDRPPEHVANGIRGRFVDATPPPLMTWSTDEKGRRIPQWKGYKLLSLHIHAKNLKEFLSKK